MKPSTEAELLAKCRQGDPDAWNLLFDTHYAATGRFIFQLSPDFTREDAEEICQEVFLSVVRSLESFHGDSQLQTWICRIAVNRARDFVEKQRAQKRGGGQTPLSLNAPVTDGTITLDPPSIAPGPDGQLIQAEQAELVRGALERLADPCREIILLRYFADLSYHEIAAALHLNEKTVSSRLSKCLDRLEMIARPLFKRGLERWEKSAASSV
jgi:RNA polymerase sigma-70 factor (ECF subfamily)